MRCSQEAQAALRALEDRKEEIEQSRRSATLFQETLRGELPRVMGRRRDPEA